MLLAIRLDSYWLRLFIDSSRSPRTRKALLHRLPLVLCAKLVSGMLIARLNLEVPVESHRETLCEGDVAYWPLSGSLVIAYEKMVKLPSQVNYLGRILNWNRRVCKYIEKKDNLVLTLLPSYREYV